MNDELFSALTLSLALTLVLEICFFFFTGKRKNKAPLTLSTSVYESPRLDAARKLRSSFLTYKKDLLLVAAVNVVTNPVVVLLFWSSALYTDWNRVAVMVPLELLAVCTEGYYYKKYGQYFNHPYLFSAAANAFSFGIGALLQLFI